jgi:hypothetical protein
LSAALYWAVDSSMNACASALLIWAGGAEAGAAPAVAIESMKASAAPASRKFLFDAWLCVSCVVDG